MDILYLLDRLEEVVRSAAPVPLTSRAMIDKQECLDVVDQIRLALPEEVKVARRVLSERDQIIAEANDRADQLVARAEEQIALRVEDEVVLQAARDRAQAVVEGAEREARELREQADEYAARVFTSLLNRLRQVEGAIEEGLQGYRADQQRGRE
jgi:vacuolar-type H+-ATPase subunit H